MTNKRKRLRKGDVQKIAQKLGIDKRNLYVAYCNNVIKDFKDVDEKWIWRYNYPNNFTIALFQSLYIKINENFGERYWGEKDYEIAKWCFLRKEDITKIKKEEKRKKYYSPISAWRKYISTAFATNKKNILIKANPKKNKYRFLSIKYFKFLLKEKYNFTQADFRKLVSEVKKEVAFNASPKDFLTF